jgi:hypothetical protein
MEIVEDRYRAPGAARAPGVARIRSVAAVAALAVLLSGCGLFVSKKVYEKEQKSSKAKLGFIEKQLLAHTQILQNHGSSINEVQLQLQLRDLGTRTKKSPTRVRRKSRAKKKVSRKSKSMKSASLLKGRLRGGHPIGRSLFVRSTYRGLPLNYAGGYRKPRGKRYPYKLPPGTLVEVLSADSRGFTRIRVKSGRWKGEKMWVRTRWLVRKSPARKS